MTQFAGLYVAVITPFTKDFEIDFEELREHAIWLMDSGVTGLVATGSCGEYAALEDRERDQVIRTLGTVTRGRVPLIVGVAAAASRMVAHWATLAKEIGASGVMALPPILYKPRWEEVRAHYALLNDVGLPIVVYNNPQDTAVDITPQRIGELARDFPNIVAIKEFSLDVRRVSAIREHSDVEIMAGADDLVIESLLAGATGWIAGMANIIPKESVTLLRLIEGGQLEEAWALYRKLLPLLRYDSTPGLVQAIKVGLEQVGRRGGPTRPPRLPLPAEDVRVIQSVLSNV